MTLKTYIEGGLPSNHVAKIEKIFGSTGTLCGLILKNLQHAHRQRQRIDPSITAQTECHHIERRTSNVNFLGSYNVAMVRFFLYGPAQDIGSV